jgi:amino acid transporter
MRALGVTWLVVATIVSLGELGELFALSSIAVLMQFGTSALALLVLAARHDRGLRPAQSWPAIPTLAVAAVLVASGATVREALVAAGAIVLGFALLRLARPRGLEPSPRG